jgi:hypothetical protein
MAPWIPPTWRFDSFYDLKPHNTRCLYIIQPRDEPKPRRCRYDSSDSVRAAALRQAILAASEVTLLQLESYILCLCCMSGNATHAHRIESAGVLRPLAERWLEEITGRKEAGHTNLTTHDDPPSQSTFPDDLCLERIPCDAEYIPFLTNPNPSECVAKKMLQPIGTNDYESRTGSVYGFGRERSPGFVKIGFTSGSVRIRLSEWAGCGYVPKLLFHIDDVPNARRVEWLTHYELRNEWRKERWCANCLCPHQEWFEVSVEKAEKVVRDWASFLTKAKPYEVNGSIKCRWEAAVNSMESEGVEITAENLLEVYKAEMAADLERNARPAEDKEEAHVADNENQDGEVGEGEDDRDEGRYTSDAASPSVVDSAIPEAKRLLEQSVGEAEGFKRLQLEFTQLGLAGNQSSVSSVSPEQSRSDGKAQSSLPTSVALVPRTPIFNFEPIKPSAFQLIPFQIAKLPGSQPNEQSPPLHNPEGAKPSTSTVLPLSTDVFKFELPDKSNKTKPVRSLLPVDDKQAATTTLDATKSKEARHNQVATSQNQHPTTVEDFASSFNFVNILKALPQANDNLSPEQIPLPPSPILVPVAVSNDGDGDGEGDSLEESSGNHILEDFSREESLDLEFDVDPSQDSDDGSEVGDEEEDEEEEEEVTLVEDDSSSCLESTVTKTVTKTRPAAESWDRDTTLIGNEIADPLVLKMGTLAVASELSIDVSVTTEVLLGDSSPTAGAEIGDGLLPLVEIAA